MLRPADAVAYLYVWCVMALMHVYIYPYHRSYSHRTETRKRLQHEEHHRNSDERFVSTRRRPADRATRENASDSERNEFNVIMYPDFTMIYFFIDKTFG